MGTINFNVPQTINGSTITASGGQALPSPFYPSRDANDIIGTDEYAAAGNITFTSGAATVFGHPATTSTATLTNANAPFIFNTTTNTWDRNPNSIVDYDYDTGQLRIEERVTIRLTSYVAQHTMFQGDNTCRPVFYGVDFVFDDEGAANEVSFNWLGAAAGSSPANSDAAPSFYNCRMVKRDTNRGDFRWFGTNYLIRGFEHVATSTSRVSGQGVGALYECGAPPNDPPFNFELIAPNYRTFGQRVALPFYRNTPASTDQYSFRGLRVNNFSGFISNLPSETRAQQLSRKNSERGVTLINSSSRVGLPYTTDNATNVNPGGAGIVTDTPLLPIILSAKDVQFGTTFGPNSPKEFGGGTINGFQRVVINAPESGYTIRAKRTAIRSYEHRGQFAGGTIGLAAGTFAYVAEGAAIRPSNGVLHRTMGTSLTDFTAPGESTTETFGNGSRITTTFASVQPGGTIPAIFTQAGNSRDGDNRTNTGRYAPVDDISFNQQAVDATSMSDGLIAWEGLDAEATSASQAIFLPTYWQGLYNSLGNPIPTFFFRYTVWAEKDNRVLDGTLRVFDFRPEAATNDFNRPFREGNNEDVVIDLVSPVDPAYTMDRNISTSGPGITGLAHLYDSLKQYNRTRGVAAYDSGHLNTQTPLFTLDSLGFIDIGSRGIIGVTTGAVVSDDGSNLSWRLGTVTSTSFRPTPTDTAVNGITTTGTINLNTAGLTGTNMSFAGGTLTDVYGPAVDGVSPFRLSGPGTIGGSTVNFGTVNNDIRVRVDGYDLSNAMLTRTGTGTVTLSVVNGANIPNNLPAGFAAETDTILSNDLSVPVYYAIARVNTNGTLTNVRSGMIDPVGMDGVASTVMFNNSVFEAGQRIRIRFSATGYLENTTQTADATFNNVLLIQSQTFTTSEHLTRDLNYSAPTTPLPGTRNALSVTNAIQGMRTDTGPRTISIRIQTGATTTEDITYTLTDANQLIDTGTRLGIEFREGTAGGLGDTETVQAMHVIKSTEPYALTCLHNNIINILAAQDNTTMVMDDRYIIWVPQGFNTGHFFTGVGRTPAAVAALGTSPLIGRNTNEGDPSAQRIGQTNTSPSETITVFVGNRPSISGISSSSFGAGLQQVTTAIDTSESNVIRTVEDNAL